MGKHLITATIYDKKGNLLSSAQNNYGKSHPIQAMFAAKVGEPDRIFLHAELSALLRLRKDDRPFRIHVSRYTKDGKPANAQPCRVCQAALKHWGVSKIEYTL